MKRTGVAATWCLALATAIAGLGALGAGCGSRDRGGLASSSSMHVLSSITDGAVLSDPVQWVAQPVGVPTGDSVSQVEFSIDGRVVWTEHKPPYFFNDDRNQLYPWVLGAGQHHLAVHLLTTRGRAASTQAQVTVAPNRRIATLRGTYLRHVTAADIHRTQRSRHMPADHVLPVGVWRLDIATNGVFFFDDPQGGGGSEAFTALADGALTLQGPANWLEAPSRQGGFCGVEPTGTYRWARHGNTLVLTARSDRCADRNSMFTGTWRQA